MMTQEFLGFVEYIRQHELHVHSVRVLQQENLRWAWDKTRHAPRAAFD